VDPLALTDGFADWQFCSHEQRVESHPNFFFDPAWGPGFVSGASGCGCGGGASFSGNPQTAAMGFGLVPPNDLAAGNPGILPPDGHDHPFVLASTGEVVYVETDFVIPGVGFDFRWTRLWRSGLPNLSRDFGPGWSHTAEIALRENVAGTIVEAYLGNGRVEDEYTWNSGTSEWDSPAGFYDKLVKTTPGGGADPYYTKTDKTGVVWTFDQYIDGARDIFYCTKIEDPWGNTIELEYDSTNAHLVDKVTDAEGRELTFTRNGSLQITEVTMSSTAVGDYGNVEIDYTYSGGNLDQVDKHWTRLADGGTKQRPYTEYTYTNTAGVDDNMLNLVKDCGTTILDFDYSIYDSTTPRCSMVTNADGEEFTYTYDVSSTNNSVTEDVTRYIDPFGEKQEFVYTDLSSDDRTIEARRDFLEDEDGDDITNAALTEFSRDCDCGRIDQITYTDGSEEKWTYDSWGNITKYTRVSSDVSDTDLVKQWTYDDFDDYCRMLTSSGWLRAEANPASKVTWTWNSDGTLQRVAHPTVTSGQISSQTIEWDYTWSDIGGGLTDGVLETVTNPADEKVEYAYSGDTLTLTQDPDIGGLQLEHTTVRDVFGNTTQTEDPSGVTSQWDTTVTPDGRVLKVEGPNGQETKYEYNLRGFRTEADKLLEVSPASRVETTWAYSDSGRVETIVTDAASGGIQAMTEHTFDETNRYTQQIGADEFGSKSKIGYGSHNLSWESYHVDDSGASPTETLVGTAERDTMGRVTATVDRGGHRTEYEYDGYGRQTKVITALPGSKDRETISTLEDDGRAEKIEVKVVGTGTTTYAVTKYYYDEANRQYRMTREDPESVLLDRITEVERDEIGRAAFRIDARDKERETQWDAVGRIKKTIDPVGNEMQYAYNDTARTTTVTAHEYNTDTASFIDYVAVTTTDASGRMTSIKLEGSANGNRTTSFTYDEAGRRLSMTAPLNQKKDWEYDKLGRQTKETVRIDASTDAITTTYWSAGGRKERVADANAINTRWTYNSYGQKLTIEYDDQAAQTYTRTYDTHGRLSSITDPEGLVKTYNYDSADRVDYFDLTYPGSTDLVGPDRVDYTYNDMDRITTAKTQSESGGTYADLTSVTRAYNGYGELESETQYGSRTIEYDYDVAGNLEEITYPSGGPIIGVQFTRDDNGRVDTVKRKLSTDVEGTTMSAWEVTAEFEYAGHREYERAQANYDLTRKQIYTSFREPDELTYKETSSGDLLTGLDSDWDDAGRMVARERIHDAAGATEMGEAFRYDDMGRLTSIWRDLEDPHSFTSTDPTAATANFLDEVVYDIGKVYERDGVTVTPEAGTPIETIAVDFNGDPYQTSSYDGTTMAWDKNGQLTDVGTGTDYTWTGLGQLAKVEITGQTDRDYTYDAFGRRVSTEVGSQVNEFLYNGWHMIGEYDFTASEWLWQEIPLDRGEEMLEHIALDTEDLDSDSDTDEYRPYAVHEDFQSTVWGLSDTDGDLLERYDYSDPYGVSSSRDLGGNGLGDYATDVFHRKRLHGGFVEELSELYDFRNRWLDPATAGWMSRDPLDWKHLGLRYEAFLASSLQMVDYFGLHSSPPPCRDGYFPDEGEGCPQADLRDSICADTQTRGALEGQGGFWADWYKAMCSTKRDGTPVVQIQCDCKGCPLDENGRIVNAVTVPFSVSRAVKMTFYYFPDSMEDIDLLGLGGSRNSLQGASQGSRECCACTGLDGSSGGSSFFHESLHATCYAANGFQSKWWCAEGLLPFSPTDAHFDLGGDVAGLCITGLAPPNSGFCKAVNEKLDKWNTTGIFWD